MILLKAVDRNSIVTLVKKRNFFIAKTLNIRSETVWKVVKKFQETGETCNRPGQGRKRTVRTKYLMKNMREKLRRNSLRSAVKMAAEAGISQTSMRQILKEDLITYPYKMLKTHVLSTTHERMRPDRCQHILNLMKDGTAPNLVFNDETKFDIRNA